MSTDLLADKIEKFSTQTLLTRDELQIIVAALRAVPSPGTVGVREAQMYQSLIKIAAYDDSLASEKLAKTGSYSGFDEPGSVEIARNTIRELAALSPSHCTAGRREELEKILHDAFYTGEPGQSGAIKVATDTILALAAPMLRRETVAKLVDAIDRCGARLKRMADEDVPPILYKREAELIAMRVEKLRDAIALTSEQSGPTAGADPLIGLDERLDRLLLTATDNSRFVLSTESAKNIVEIVREWLRCAGSEA